MADALATLPWVEKDRIQADRKTRQVKFTVTDRAAFDPAAVRDVIKRKGYSRTEVLKGPTDS